MNDHSTAELPIPTREEAEAIRPRLDDPTYLMNGNVHPAYVRWLVRPYKEQHPFSEYLVDHLDPVTGADGYFDRKKVKRVLGPSAIKMWGPRGMLPSRARIPLVAEFLGVTVAELTDVVEKENEIRREHESVLSHCRSLPYNLLTHEQIVAGVPCPACGRPWLGRGNRLDLCGMERQGLDRMLDGPYDPKEPLEPGSRRPSHLFENHIANLLSKGLAERDTRGWLIITEQGHRAVKDEKQEEAQYQALHGDCRAGRTGFRDSQLHCLRCCGYPAPNPEVVAEVRRMMAVAAEDRARREQAAKAAAPPTREDLEKQAQRRAKRIKALEAELAKLRHEEERASNQPEAPK